MTTTLHLRQRLVEIAKREVGVVEAPAHSNSGKRVREYQAATNLGGTGWPWCAAFVCWCIREWGRDAEVLDALKLTRAGFEAWRPKTAAAFGFHEWAAKRKLLVMSDGMEHTLHTADLMTFDMSHIGIVESDRQGFVYTIEGNTSASGSREGGGVFAKTRERREARKFIRLLK